MVRAAKCLHGFLGPPQLGHLVIAKHAANIIRRARAGAGMHMWKRISRQLR